MITANASQTTTNEKLELLKSFLDLQISYTELKKCQHLLTNSNASNAVAKELLSIENFEKEMEVGQSRFSLINNLIWLYNRPKALYFKIKKHFILKNDQKSLKKDALAINEQYDRQIEKYEEVLENLNKLTDIKIHNFPKLLLDSKEMLPFILNKANKLQAEIKANISKLSEEIKLEQGKLAYLIEEKSSLEKRLYKASENEKIYINDKNDYYANKIETCHNNIHHLDKNVTHHKLTLRNSRSIQDNIVEKGRVLTESYNAYINIKDTSVNSSSSRSLKNFLTGLKLWIASFWNDDAPNNGLSSQKGLINLYQKPPRIPNYTPSTATVGDKNGCEPASCLTGLRLWIGSYWKSNEPKARDYDTGSDTDPVDEIEAQIEESSNHPDIYYP